MSNQDKKILDSYLKDQVNALEYQLYENISGDIVSSYLFLSIRNPRDKIKRDRLNDIIDHSVASFEPVRNSYMVEVDDRYGVNGKVFNLHTVCMIEAKRNSGSFYSANIDLLGESFLFSLAENGMRPFWHFSNYNFLGTTSTGFDLTELNNKIDDKIESYYNSLEHYVFETINKKGADIN